MSAPNLYPRPLDRSRSEIRLLTLLPVDGSSGPTIHFELAVVSLDDKPDFDALSYVWGDESHKENITVNGNHVQVMANLAGALKRLRNAPDRRLWVDYICINQLDDDEKCFQIPLMGRIFSEAASVLVWLGEPSQEMGPFLELVAPAEVSEGVSSSDGFWDYTLRYARLWKKRLDMLISLSVYRFPTVLRFLSHAAGVRRGMAALDAASGLTKILLLPYWMRMWTFQEFWLAENEPVMICGPYRFSLRTLEWALSLLGTVASRPLHLLVEPERPHVNEGQSSESLLAADQQELLARHHQHAVNNNIHTHMRAHVIISGWREWKADDRKIQQALLEPTFFYLLLCTADRSCRIEHDRFYALYGLLPELAGLFPPTYDKPFETLSHEIVMFLVKAQVLGDLLGHFFLWEGDQSRPSWYPDLRHACQTYVTNYNETRVSPKQLLASDPLATSIPASLPWELMKLSDDEMSITFPVWTLGPCMVLLRFGQESTVIQDQIANIGRALQNPSRQPRRSPLLQPWRLSTTARAPNAFDRIAKILFFGTSEGAVQSLSTVTESFGQTDVGQPHRQAGQDERSDQAGTPVIKPRDSPAFMEVLNWRLQCLRGKTLFSVAGRLGIGPGGMKDCDDIVVSPWFGHPLVLRYDGSISNFTGDTSHHCQLLGFSHVDGLMDNEMQDEQLCASINTRAARKLVTIF